MRPIAIYLPQFHPIPENDEWWEKGFTEWTNVTKAKPLFRGHYQPHLSSDLGFYDLRVAETRKQQAMLAKEFGIYGFCYYHYWFNGKRLLERPFNEVYRGGSPDFPFMLFWANESWSRRWLGEERSVLIKQTYSEEDDYRHAEYLAEVFSDSRYIRVNNRPVFIIYRPLNLPDASLTIKVIREVCKMRRLDPFLVASNSHAERDSESRLLEIGFDSVLNFRPQLGALPDVFNERFLWRRVKRNMLKHRVLSGKLKIYDYNEALDLMQKMEPASYDNVIPCAFVGWDNTPRRNENGIIMYNNTDKTFRDELMRIKYKLERSSNPSDLVFINAWNEWGEGNHLEPDMKNGKNFLAVVREVFCGTAVDAKTASKIGYEYM